MATLKKDHILGAGSGAVAGGATGAAIGAAVAGPAGLAAGAVAGGALGAVIGDRMAGTDDRREELGHFEQIHDDMPYRVEGMAWRDYAPAYQLGLDAWRRRADEGTAFEQAEPALAAEWPAIASAAGSRLNWAQARAAAEHAWRSLAESAAGAARG